MKKKNTIYLNALPKKFAMAALCTDQEIEMVPEIGFLKEKILKSKETINLKFKKIQGIFFQIFHSHISLEQFIWAWYTVKKFSFISFRY